jgi:hypothetical protein
MNTRLGQNTAGCPRQRYSSHSSHDETITVLLSRRMTEALVEASRRHRSPYLSRLDKVESPVIAGKTHVERYSGCVCYGYSRPPQRLRAVSICRSIGPLQTAGVGFAVFPCSDWPCLHAARWWAGSTGSFLSVWWPGNGCTRTGLAARRSTRLLSRRSSECVPVECDVSSESGNKPTQPIDPLRSVVDLLRHEVAGRLYLADLVVTHRQKDEIQGEWRNAPAE